MEKSKRIKISVIIITVVVIAAAVFAAVKLSDKDTCPAETTAEPTEVMYDEKGHVVTTEPEPFETVAPAKNTQLGVVADGWLKIKSVGETGGKICVVAENVSERAVEHAVLAVSADNKKLTFNISAVLPSMEVLLYCNEDYTYNADSYYVNWTVEEKILYKTVPTLHEDVFKVSGADGSISVKNISGKDIEGTIYICYKKKNNGVLTGDITYRARLDGLEAGATSVISSDIYKKDKHEIIFIDYGG